MAFCRSFFVAAGTWGSMNGPTSLLNPSPCCSSPSWLLNPSPDPSPAGGGGLATAERPDIVTGPLSLL